MTGAEEVSTVKVSEPEGQIEKIYDLLRTAIAAYCSHEDTPEFTYAQIISALTAVLAMETVEGGCNSEARLAVTLTSFSTNLESSIRSIWAAQEHERKGMN